MDIVQRLKEFRLKKRLSQEDVAYVLKITQQQYSRYETGKNEMPARYIFELCKVYQMSADWLLGLKDSME